MFGDHAIFSHVARGMLFFISDQPMTLAQAAQEALDVLFWHATQTFILLRWRNDTTQLIFSTGPNVYTVSDLIPAQTPSVPFPQHPIATHTWAQLVTHVAQFAQESAALSVKFTSLALRAVYKPSDSVQEGDVVFDPGQDINAITMNEIPAGVPAYYLPSNGQQPKLYTIQTLRKLDMFQDQHSGELVRENPYTRQKFNLREVKRARPR